MSKKGVVVTAVVTGAALAVGAVAFLYKKYPDVLSKIPNPFAKKKELEEVDDSTPKVGEEEAEEEQQPPKEERLS